MLSLSPLCLQRDYIVVDRVNQKVSKEMIQEKLIFVKFVKINLKAMVMVRFVEENVLQNICQ